MTPYFRGTQCAQIVVSWAGYTNPAGVPMTYQIFLEKLVSSPGESEAYKLVGDVGRAVPGDAANSDRAFELTLSGEGTIRSVVCVAATMPPICAMSKKFFFDTSPPEQGELCIGAGAEAQCGSSAFIGKDSLSLGGVSSRVWWRGFEDPHSGLGEMSAVLGSAADASDIQGAQDVRIVRFQPRPRSPLF